MPGFEWDEEKNQSNQQKHGVSFEVAQRAFNDRGRLILRDKQHSEEEMRFFCIGKVEQKILTVRFTYREDRIRIIGAGFWRKGKQLYTRENRKSEE